MHHTRDEVVERTVREFKLLDNLVKNLTEEEWEKLVPRPEGKDPWTVKDALAHVTHWKADIIRSIEGRRRPPEERGLKYNDENHLIYTRWHETPPQEVLAWHRRVQKDLLKALKEAPDKWFTGKDRAAQWPYDLDGHSNYHRARDIEKALKSGQ